MAGQAKSWIVDFDSDAVIDFEDVKSRGDRKAVFNAVQKLRGSVNLREARAAVRDAGRCGEEEGLRPSARESGNPPWRPSLIR